MQLLVKQSRPNSPMATRNLYLQARPVEVYPIVYALLPGMQSISGIVSTSSACCLSPWHAVVHPL